VGADKTCTTGDKYAHKGESTGCGTPF
jgi:hypothetical protein